MAIEAVLRALEPTIGRIAPESLNVVGGGSINRSYSLPGSDGQRYFLKLNRASRCDMFEAERDGLAELRNARAVRVPAVHACGTAGGHAYLLLEHLRFGASDEVAGRRLGERLAAQHRVIRDAFGWHRDNTIGSTPQVNTPSADWIEFWRDRRLGRQLELAVRNGLARRVVDQARELMDRLPAFFVDHSPVASLLHGDLWGGNWAATAAGEPVIFDPAVYYGDREADIAMTLLFGGFGRGFYETYAAAWPLDPGFRRRADLYNLYHVLNHFNLFGGGYERQAGALLDGLLA